MGSVYIEIHISNVLKKKKQQMTGQHWAHIFASKVGNSAGLTLLAFAGASPSPHYSLRLAA